MHRKMFPVETEGMQMMKIQISQPELQQMWCNDAADAFLIEKINGKTQTDIMTLKHTFLSLVSFVTF